MADGIGKRQARRAPRSKDEAAPAVGDDGEQNWRSLARLAQALGQPAQETGLAEGLAVLGQLFKTRGLAITIQDSSASHVLEKWGRIPSHLGLEAGAADDRWASRPLILHKREFGRLWMRRGTWESDPALLRLLQAAVQLVATAAHAQIVLQRERDQRALAETLQHISRVLTSTLDLEQVLARILDELARLVPYNSATVMLLYEGRLHLQAHRGFKRLAPNRQVNSVTFIPEQTPMVMEVLSGTRPVIVQDTRDVPGWIWLPFSTHIRSWMGVPLRVHDRVTGLFSIDKSQPGFFTARHAALAAAVAPHAAIAIENARLFQELRAAETQLRQLSAHTIEVQEAERQRIGSELHDHAGQAILAMRAELQILARELPLEAQAAQAQLMKVDDILRDTARDLRLLSHELRSHLLDELGLVSAVQQQVREFAERFGVQAELVVAGNTARRYPRSIELAAFRIAQEALTNIARHSQAHSVRVDLTGDGASLRLAVRDDGVGFDLEHIRTRSTVGLVGMRERALAANGTFQCSSQPGEGVEIIVEFPVEQTMDQV